MQQTYRMPRATLTDSETWDFLLDKREEFQFDHSVSFIPA